MELDAQLVATATQLVDLVDGLGPGELERTTASPGRTVHDALHELVARGGAYASTLRGAPRSGGAAVLLWGHVPRDEVRTTLADLRAALAEAPGHVYAPFVALDLRARACELALATGRAS